MFLPSISLLLTFSSALSIPQPQQQQFIVSNPPPSSHDAATYRIPTIHESAIMARRILHLTTIGTLVTSFPDSSPSAPDDSSILEDRPPEVQGSPIGLMEYIADCEPDSGNPTILAINIATPFKNYNAGSNISLGVRWWPKQSTFYTATTASHDDDDDDDDGDPTIPTPHTPAALPRFSLHGHLEPIPTSDLIRHIIPACFLKAHPDSVLWQPGNDISHESVYMRFVVEHVYWFGGFGDRARIGWLPLREWRAVTREEVEACRLPGEEE